MTYTIGGLQVTATYTGNKPAPWNSKNRNHHTVKVKGLETGLTACFDFWASIASPFLDSQYDVLNALRCIVDDTLSGTMTFHDFCAEFGYDEDSRKAEQTWKACKHNGEKLRRIYPHDPYELYELLEEYA